MKKILQNSLICLSLLALLVQCKSISQGKRFANCQFRATNIENFALVGVRLPKSLEDISQLNFIDLGTVMNAFGKGGEFPLSFTQNIEVRNPNNDVAAIDKLDWILYLDGNEMTQGTIDQRIEVQANGTAIMPVNATIDLRKVINSGSAGAFFNLIKNLMKQSDTPSQVKIKVRPSFRIAGTNIPYPLYISLSQEFTSN
jgi:LEA14-like dessication related protein